jgi:hypothetical protein
MSRGAAMVEFAILAPLLIALLLWANYFWEVQVARIKAAEVARYVAFERTVRKDLPQIIAEAKDRYKDLDGSNKGVEKPQGFQNEITLEVTAKLAGAPLSGSISDTNSDRAGGSAGGFLSDISSLIGDSVEAVIGLLGFKTNQGAVHSEVTMTVKNKIIPQRIVNYISGFSDNRLDLTFKDSFFVYHDTWRAWDNGIQPSQTYPRVEQLTYNRVKDIAFLGLGDKAGSFLNPIGDFLEVLGLERIPLDPEYIRDSVLMKKVQQNGRYSGLYGQPNRTVPGDKLQALYWLNDTQACYGNSFWSGNQCWGREPADITKKRGLTNSGGDTANWPMRAYNCRGDFFQGAVKSGDPEVVYTLTKDKSYFNYASDACEDD